MIYTTTDFEGQQSAGRTLLIGVGMTSNRLAVVDEAQQVRFAASYDPERPAQEVTAVLERDYAAVKLAIADCRYMFVPADVYDEQQHDTYLRYLPHDDVGTAQVASITPLGVKLLHQTNRVGVERLAARYPNAEYYPQVQSLLHASTAQEMPSGEPLLVIERHAPRITIAIFNQGKFLYCHDFESINEDDFTYHLLAVIQRFGLGDLQLTILLAGDIGQGDGYHERALAYGGKVAWATGNAWASVQVPEDMLPHQHRFFSLFGLYQCES